MTKYIGIYIYTIRYVYLNSTIYIANNNLSVLKSIEYKESINELVPIINNILINILKKNIKKNKYELVKYGLYLSDTMYSESILLNHNSFFNDINYGTLFQIESDYFLSFQKPYYKKIFINTKLLKNTFSHYNYICDKIDNFNNCKKNQIKYKLKEYDPNIKMKWYYSSNYLKKLLFEKIANEVVMYFNEINKQKIIYSHTYINKNIIETDV